MSNIKKYTFIVALIFFVCFLFGCSEEAFSPSGQEGLFINEVVSSNAYSLVDDDLGAPDWIEIYNGTSSSIALKGYGLSDNVNQPYKWTFPDIRIAPGEYLVVYATTQIEGAAVEKNALCTGFKLSKSGETVLLTDPSSSIVQELNIPELLTDISWGRNAQREYCYFLQPTPGEKNDDEGIYSLNEIVQAIDTGAVRINEIMADNSSFIADSDGEYFGWVELLNTSDETVSLGGYYLSDNASRSTKWKFPDLEIKPGELLIVYMSGKDRRDGELHTSFKLGSVENGLWFANPTGALEDHVQWQNAPPADFSLGRDNSGGFNYFGLPTPGEPNGDFGLDSLEYKTADAANSVRINEFLINNKYSRTDEDGDRNPWIEIYNASAQAANMNAFVLSDNKSNPTKWRFPELTLGPGEYLVVIMSGKNRSAADGELHTGFRLSGNDTELMLTNLETLESEVIPLPEAMIELDNVSYGRALSDPSQWEFFAQPTPGQENTTKGFEDILNVSFFDKDGVYINEVAAVTPAKSGRLDWIEIANGGAESVNLTGYFLSDSINDPYKWELPETKISAGGYALINASSKKTQQKSGVADFGISYAGEKLILSSPDGHMLDIFESGVLRPDVTSGRVIGDDSGERVFFSTPTPGKANSSDILSAYTAKPVFSRPGGYASGTLEISITCETPGARIFYTLDGSKPTQSSTEYTQPLELNSTTVVKAIAFFDGLLESDMTVVTYLFEKEHAVPVVCLSGKQSDISAFYRVTDVWTTVEREAYVEYYENDGKLGIAFPAGLRISGQSTRSAGQKSINMNLRGGYGQSEITYPFFKDFEHVTFRSLSLRNSGQDRVAARIRDAYCSMAVRDMNLDYAESRFVAVYINGEYWGLYDLKENQNDQYYAYRHNTDEDNITRIKRNQYPLSGTSAEIRAVRAFARSKNMNNEDVFAQFCEMVDADSAMDYIIAQTYFCNSDMFNQKYGGAQDYAFKWRFLFFDLDWGMKHTDRNIISAYFRRSGVPSADGTLTNMDIQYALLSNPGWKEAFIERYAHHLNTTFKKEKLLALFDEMVAEMEPEMERHISRWRAPSSMSAWESHIKDVRHFLEVRTRNVKQHLKREFNLSNERMKELFPDD